jgi:hypothetical protein
MRSPCGVRLLLAPLLVVCTAGASPVLAQTPECSPWQACRNAALAAAASGDFERFHDLAWRTVQTGPPRDTDLMQLLARAMSLSGRPGDAVVMLHRLAERGIWTDAARSDDFRRVRALAAWPEVEAMLAALEPAASLPAVGEASASPEVSEGSVAAGETAVVTPAGGSAPLPAAPPETLPAAPAAASAVAPVVAPVVAPAMGPRTRVEEAVRLPMSGLSSAAFAYDAVSGRFLLGSPQRKILVIAEESRRVDDLVRADSAGFFDITAMTIDPRRGDLWVVSAGEAEKGSAPGTGPSAALHKVQLVSGRPLGTWSVDDADQPARFTEVAVTDAGLVVVLDALGRRIFRLSPGSRRLELAARLGDLDPVSLSSSAGERRVYLAHATGLARVDLASGVATPLSHPPDVDTTGVRRLRWYRGALVAVQVLPGGERRVVRFSLGSTGRSVAGVEIIDGAVTSTDGELVAALAGDEFYYVAGTEVASADDGADPGTETIVRRVRLR